MSIDRLLRYFLSLIVISMLVGAWSPQSASAAASVTSFRPIDPEELKMTAEPLAPGAPAIILSREVDRDDSTATRHEYDYFRIKILKEEGRKYGDVEILYNKEGGNIIGIHARTIKPDGTIVKFDDKVFTKSVVKARGIKYLAKTFTLPEISPGCIIEYYYTLDMREESFYDSHWILSSELFTKAANFSLKPYPTEYHLSWVWQNLPPDAPQPAAGPDHIVRLQVANLPAFQTEDMMPPENELKARVDFDYSLDTPDSDANHYWSGVGKRLDGYLESFIGKHKAAEQAVGEIVGPNDPPEVKLQKLYARVQQLRNTTYEVEKTEEESKRSKEKEPANVDDVLRRGYANRKDLNWLYLALVRAAGFEAYGVWAADREEYFFNPSLMQSERLSSSLVLIKLNGKDIFCNPGAAFTPYGQLPWAITGVSGLQIDKKGSAWVQTWAPTSAQAQTERRATLTLSDSGDLEGTLTVTHTDIRAAHLRLSEQHADETERKTYLETSIKETIPSTSEVKLTNQPAWTNSAVPLVAEFKIKIPAWASGAGHHFIVPVGLFTAREKHIFDHAERVHPIYVEYPYSEADDINIQIPAGWRISSLPQGRDDTGKSVSYTLKAEDKNGNLHVSRTLSVNFLLAGVEYYSALRDYFQQIKTSDDQQIVLDPGTARAAN